MGYRYRLPNCRPVQTGPVPVKELFITQFIVYWSRHIRGAHACAPQVRRLGCNQGGAAPGRRLRPHRLVWHDRGGRRAAAAGDGLPV